MTESAIREGFMTREGVIFQGLALFYISPLPSRYGKNPRRVVEEKIGKIKHVLIFWLPGCRKSRENGGELNQEN